MIIGLTGKAGSGKSTVARHLVDHYGFTEVSFATPIKLMLSVIGLPEPESRDDKEKLIPGFNFSWREAAQKLGTEWGRGLDPDIWVKLLMSHLAKQLNKDFVISDVRFENEAAVLHQAGYPIVHIRGRQVELGQLAAHASEAGIVPATGDYGIGNNGTLEQIYKLVQEMIEEMTQ